MRSPISSSPARRPFPYPRLRSRGNRRIAMRIDVLPDSKRFCSSAVNGASGGVFGTGLPVQLIRRDQDPRRRPPRGRCRPPSSSAPPVQLTSVTPLPGVICARSRPGALESGRADLAATTCDRRSRQRRAESRQQRAALPRRTLRVGCRVEREPALARHRRSSRARRSAR